MRSTLPRSPPLSGHMVHGEALQLTETASHAAAINAWTIEGLHIAPGKHRQTRRSANVRASNGRHGRQKQLVGPKAAGNRKKRKEKEGESISRAQAKRSPQDY